MSDAAGTSNSYAPPPPQDRLAAELRGFGPLGILALPVLQPLGAAWESLRADYGMAGWRIVSGWATIQTEEGASGLYKRVFRELSVRRS